MAEAGYADSGVCVCVCVSAMRRVPGGRVAPAAALQRQQEARQLEALGGAEARGAGGACSAGPQRPGAGGLAGGR
eukprot:13753666-Alexandrium_andersonii.AAC.1